MDRELKCDFYFGDNLFFDLEKIDYSILTGFRSELRTLKIRSWKWHLGIIKVLRKKYDTYIITGDPAYLSNWLLLIYCNIKHKKLFMWCHGLKTEPGNNYRFVEKMEEVFYKNKMVELLLYGNYSRDLMLKLGYNGSKLHVIYNSLDSETQNYIRKTLKSSDIYEKHFQNNDPVIIFIGRLQKDKKLELIINSQKYLTKQGILFNTVFIGTGELELKLRDMSIKSSLIDRIWFYGSCYEEQQIAPLIFNATLTVSPGNIGLTAIHSLVYGTPVITHSNYHKHGPEFEAITSGITGDYFEEDNCTDLSQKISIWIRRSKFERDVIRRACYKIVDLYYNPDYQIILLKSLLK
jgi:glycosyltransferase involved in cell wall biosynthesis